MVTKGRQTALVYPSVMLSKLLILSWEVVKDEMCRTNARVDLIKILLRKYCLQKALEGLSGLLGSDLCIRSFNKMGDTDISEGALRFTS